MQCVASDSILLPLLSDDIVSFCLKGKLWRFYLATLRLWRHVTVGSSDCPTHTLYDAKINVKSSEHSYVEDYNE